MNKFNSREIKETLNELLELLPSKGRAVIIARFGLSGDKPKTLEAIGKSKGITRERVRQIEVSSFQKLKKAKKGEKVKYILNNLRDLIKEQGGFLDLEGVKLGILGQSAGLLEENQLKVILNSSKKIHYKKRKKELGDFWYLQKYSNDIENISVLYKDIVAYLKEYNKPIKLAQLLKKIKENKQFFKNDAKKILFKDKNGKNKLKIILRNGIFTDVNLLNQWGLKSWKLIRPKGVKERAYLVFQKHQKPLHFRDLTKLVNKHFDLKRPAIPETVCNVVIYFDEFVAVESGVYALKEWDLFKDSIKNDIVEFFEKEFKNNPNQKEIFRNIDQITEYVAKKQQKKIQAFVVQANLFDKNLFSRRKTEYRLKG